MLTQQRFLGATIVSFDASIGWNGESSSVNITLVEDTNYGDRFLVPTVGQPVVFQYMNWIYMGLIRNWRQSRGVDGNPLYEVTLIDPSTILNGVELILAGYTGSVNGVPNIMNIYGYLEDNFGFGGSEINDSGIPANKIISSVVDMSTSGSSYGNPPIFVGSQYIVDLSFLPSLPDYYRIGGDKITLLDLIREVCDAAQFDFFIQLTTISGLANSPYVIKVFTINRRNTPILGNITRFASTVNGVVVVDSGIELRDEVVGKFVVGGDVERIWYQFNNGTAETLNGTVVPYWGVNRLGQPIQGVEEDDDHNFDVDSSEWNVMGILAKYNIKVKELRAALLSYEDWEEYLRQFKNDVYIDINCVGSISDINDALNGQIHPMNLGPTDERQINIYRDAWSDPKLENAQRAYQYVKAIADEFYGKKFLVTIPFVLGTREPNTNVLRLSYEVTDGGFLDESDWDEAISRGLLPADIDLLSSEDGKIQSYVRFTNWRQLDFSDIPTDNLIVYNNYMFVKCSIEQDITFINPQNLFSPRVVITLPGRVKHLRDTNGLDIKALNKALNGEESSKVVGGLGMFGYDAASVIPTFAAVPLKSKLLSYGPYYAYGAYGKMEFEKDDSLVPWNYGGYDVLNLVGQARVSEKVSYMQIEETGSVSVPDTPAVGLGAAIFGNGPYVTDVKVNIGVSGVTTNYTMKTWSPQFGKVNRAYINTVSKIAKVNQEFRRKYRLLLGARNKANNILAYKIFRTPLLQRRQYQTQVGHIMTGQVFYSVGDYNQDIPMTSVANEPIQAHVGHIGTDFNRKAGMSMDALFRPYTTDVDATVGDEEMSKFEEPVDLGLDTNTYPNAISLNPFKDSDIAYVACGEDIPSKLFRDIDHEKCRALSLKLPMIAVGWGYDIHGRPIPNTEEDEKEDNLTSEFATDKNKKQNKWKAGPVDLRWDVLRKVWTSPLRVKFGKLLSDISAPNEFGEVTNFSIEVHYFKDDGSEIKTSLDSNLSCVNIDPSLEVDSGGSDVLVMVYELRPDRWVPIWVGCN